MESYLKEILNKKKLTTAEYRKGYAKLDELRKYNARIKREMTEAKKEGNEKDYHFLKFKLKREEKESLENKLKGKLSVKHKNKTITVKKSYLKRLKDPEKYLDNLHIRTTRNQIRKMEKKGKKGTAKGLYNMIENMYPDREEAKKLTREVKKRSKTKKGSFWGGILEKLEEVMEIRYKPLVTMADGVIKIIYIRTQ